MTKKRRLLWSLVFLPVALALAESEEMGTVVRFEQDFRWEGFLKGNTHTHSLRSDGDSEPDAVIRWYRDHGYQFLVMTDHNRASDPQEFQALENDRFKVIAGEEVSYASHTSRRSGRTVSVHVNSICAQRTIPPQVIDPVRDSLQSAISEVISTPGSIAQINHPNYEWALTYDDIVSTWGASLMEVANQHPYVNNEGREGCPSTEQLWDRLLSAGFWIFGVATDDMHDLRGNPGFSARRPGRGWVQVVSDRVDADSICRAMKKGKFYFSTGVEFSRIEVSGNRLEIAVVGDSLHTDGVRTQFIGMNGTVLSEQLESRPFYLLRGDETYVRAKVINADGKSAWTQPVRVVR